MKPHPKVTSAGLAGAISTLIIGVATALGLSIPPEVASAVATLAAFVAGYLR